MQLPGEKTALPRTDEEKFLEFVKACFAQKRKTLVNNLRARSEPAAMRGILVAFGLTPEARAEELSVRQLAELFTKLGALNSSA